MHDLSKFPITQLDGHLHYVEGNVTFVEQEVAFTSFSKLSWYGI